MRVLVEVTGRSLDLRGPIYHVGERLFLDTDDSRHRQVLDTPGWVRRVSPAPPSPQVVALDAPPADKMVTAADHKAAVDKGKGKHQRGH